MATERVERRLTAILAADVAGYSRLMGADEEGTLAQLKAHRRALVEPKITEHRGRIVKTTGDGILVEFPSVVDAARCAVEVQREMMERNAEVPQDKRIEFRIGINVGDVMIDRGDIFGEGVNVAARLESIAEPGGICVSGRVQEDAEGKLEIAFENAGEQQLKNIARPVRIYRIRPSGALPLPDKPSIAVLPFQNMSGDPEQEYFADGIVEEIITALSRFRQLFVIARNSSFTFKGRAVDVKQVGRELGVRYVLEGSVRKSASRVRITAQLIDASSGAHLWADRFQGALEDIFDLQDEVTVSVVGAIEPKLEQAEIERARRRPTESLGAYEYYLRGMAQLHQETPRSINEALQLFYQAIKLDREFASAYGRAAWCFLRRKANHAFSITDLSAERAEAMRLARRAIELGKDDAVALYTAAHVLAYVVYDFGAASSAAERAVTLNPNLAHAWNSRGWVRVMVGDPDTAIEHFTRTMRLSPIDPFIHSPQYGMAWAHFMRGEYDQGCAWASRVLQEHSTFIHALGSFAANASLAGRLHEAKEAVARLREIHPFLCTSHLSPTQGQGLSAAIRRNRVRIGLPEYPTEEERKRWALAELFPIQKTEYSGKVAEALRKAGLPE